VCSSDGNTGAAKEQNLAFVAGDEEIIRNYRSSGEKSHASKTFKMVRPRPARHIQSLLSAIELDVAGCGKRL
jgi:hypothetical protein